MNATAAPNGTSTIGQRAQYLLEARWDGNSHRMADHCNLGHSALIDVMRGKARKDQEWLFLKNCGKLRGINPAWLREGAGTWNQPVEAGPVAPPAEDPVVTRTRRAIDGVFLTETNASRLTRIPPDRLRACTERGVRPSDDDLLAVANAGQVSIDWLMSGEGEMLIPPPPESPVEVPVVVAPLEGHGEAVVALAGRLEALERTLTEVQSLGYRNRDIGANNWAASEIRGDSFQAAIAVLQSKMEHLEGQQRVLLMMSGTIDDLCKRVEAVEKIPEAIRVDFRKVAGDIERSDKEFREKTLKQAVAEAKAYRDEVKKIEEHAQGVIRTTVAITKDLRDRIEALEGKAAKPRVRREAELKPDESIAVKDWAELPGEHQAFFRALEKRKRASHLLGQQYTIARPDHPEGEFRVCDLRLVHDYLRQLPQDGKANLADWMAFFRHAHSQKG